MARAHSGATEGLQSISAKADMDMAPGVAQQELIILDNIALVKVHLVSSQLNTWHKAKLSYF